MTLARRSPFGLLRDLQQQLDDAFSDEAAPPPEDGLSRWSPKVDVFEENENIVFEIEAPGVNKDDLDISIEDNRLVIRGERREQREAGEDRDYYRSERFFGTFQRSFSLPDTIDAESVEASYDDGVLTVSLPKAAEAQRKSIEIN